MSKRKFEDHDAVRGAVPLLIGLTGASSSGKTLSALRLATGMQQVTGGDIHVIDTEHRRALHYADDFKFRHTDFTPPFSPLDYLAVIEHCTERGAKILVVDSTSHEHEGPGGVLEWHQAEVERLSKLWKVAESKTVLPAWGKPKAARRRLLNATVQLGVSAIFCFRAKEKLKIRTGQDPVQLGWMPIGGEEFVFEMTVNCLLYPSSDGTPTWDTDMPGEKTMMKLPAQFRDLFAKPRPLDENHGVALAEWARGGEKPAASPAPAPASDDKANLLRDIKHEFVLAGITGQSDHERTERKACLRDFFDAERWDVIEGYSAQSLRKGLGELREHFTKGAA